MDSKISDTRLKLNVKNQKDEESTLWDPTLCRRLVGSLAMTSCNIAYVV